MYFLAFLLVQQDSLVAQLLKNLLQCRRPRFDTWVGNIPWRRNRLPTLVFLGFPDGSAGKEFLHLECRQPGFDPLVAKIKGIATHSGILAWRIPWTEEPGRLPSMGSQSQTRLNDSLSLY